VSHASSGGRVEAEGSIPAAAVAVGRSMFATVLGRDVFSAQQAVNLVAGAASAGSRPAAGEAFDAVTRAVEGQFGGVFRGAFKAGRSLISGPR